MVIFHKIAALQAWLQQQKTRGKKSGFVPTMGALHKGHLTLVQQCIADENYPIASIFVNPTQFNDPADFAKYPQTIAQDLRLLHNVGCEVVFLPSVDEIYPNGLKESYYIDLGEIENRLEGFFRPGHFQGVCQVVERLLKAVEPDFLYLGQKDFQQCMVIQAMMNIRQLPVRLIIVPTVREANGLAMSSRNMRLSPTARQKASAIYRQIQLIKAQLGKKPVEVLVIEAKDALTRVGFEKIDYVAIAEPATLKPIEKYNAEEQVVVLVAAFIEGVRLIDNFVL